MPKMNMVQALNLALRQEMEKDDRVVALGEDVGRDGGVFRVTDGLIDRFGDDPSNLATGEYEIAFINFKEGHKAKAKELFTALLARYDGPGGAAFPDRYKVLSKIILAEIH